jgi:hypothetical protein
VHDVTTHLMSSVPCLCHFRMCAIAGHHPCRLVGASERGVHIWELHINIYQRTHTHLQRLPVLCARVCCGHALSGRPRVCHSTLCDGIRLHRLSVNLSFSAGALHPFYFLAQAVARARGALVLAAREVDELDGGSDDGGVLIGG